MTILGATYICIIKIQIIKQIIIIMIMIDDDDDYDDDVWLYLILI
jgi:hypothetical protein